MKSLVFLDSNKILLHCSPTRNTYFSAKFSERPTPSVQITYQCVFNISIKHFLLSDEACTNTLNEGWSQAGVYYFLFWNTAYNDYDLIKKLQYRHKMCYNIHISELLKTIPAVNGITRDRASNSKSFGTKMIIHHMTKI